MPLSVKNKIKHRSLRTTNVTYSLDQARKTYPSPLHAPPNRRRDGSLGAAATAHLVPAARSE